MAERAQITSIEAIEAFRASLILYLGKARPTLEEVFNEMQRTRLWLQIDQRQHWEHEIRLRRKKLESAQAELFNARLSQLQQATASQHLAVRRAQQDLAQAESKLAALKKWDRELENRSAPLLKEIESLLGYLTTEMPKALSYLGQTVKTLEAYAGIGLPAAPAPAAANADAKPPNPDTPVPGSAGSAQGENP